MTKNVRARITIEEKGVKRYVDIDKDSFVLGRAPNVDVPIPDEMISRQQLKVTLEDETVWIEDLGSSNGTFLDQAKLPIRERIQLKKHHTLSLGSKSGPFVFIEPLTQTGIVENPLMREERVPEVVVKEEPIKKVVNGPESFPPRRTALPPREKLALVTPEIREKVEPKKSEAERNIFEQIKHLMNLEAEEIQKQAVLEAKQIKAKANDDALKIIATAKDEATRKLSETEAIIHQKTTALQELEDTAHDNLDRLRNEHYELLNNVNELKRSEQEHHTALTQLRREIEAEEAKIARERDQIQIEKNDLAEAKKKIEAEYRDLELEERKIKARIEVDTLEAKSKIAQIYTAAEKAQALKDTLEPEVQALKLQKEHVEQEIRDVEKERRNLEYNLERLNKELEMANYNLEVVKKDQELTRKDIEHSKQGLAQFEADLNKRDKETQYLAERTKKESEDILDEANRKAKKLVDEAEAEVRKLTARQEKLKSEIEKVKEESARRVSSAQEEAQKILAKSSADALTIKKSAEDHLLEKQVQAKALIDDAQRESTDLLTKSREDATKITDNANTESAKIIESAKKYSETKKKESDAMLEQLKAELKNRQKESMVAFAATEDKRLAIEEQIANLEKDHKERLAESHAQAQEIITKAQNEARELLANSQVEVDKYRKTTEASIQVEFEKRKAENEALRQETELQRKKLTEKLDAEFKELKQKQEATLAELRQIEMVNIKELRRKAEEEILNSKSEKAKMLSSNIYAMIAGELYKAKNKVIDDNFIEPFSKELKEMVVDIMLDKPGAQADRLQQVLKKSIDSRGKEKQFWSRLGYTAGGVFVVILLLIAFPSIYTAPKEAIVSAFTEKDTSQADAYVKQKVEEARQRMTFSPPTTPEYKGSYVDNVLYTTDYEPKRQDKAFQDKWILELNDFFINDLDVKDTTIIKFVSLESTLIRDLAKLKNQVDPQNPDQKIEEMRQREKEFKEKLGVIFDDHGKVSRYYDYSEKFWNKFYK